MIKKPLSAVLCAAVLCVPGRASAEILKNFRLGGQIDIQATAAQNITDFSTRANPAPNAAANNDRIGDAQTRVMLFLDWDLLDDVHSHVTLRKSDRTYGHIGNTTNQGTGQTLTQPGQGVLGNVVVDEANIKIDKIGGQVDATFGRQFYGRAGSLVIYFGPWDKPSYGMGVSAIDAGRFDWDDERFGVTGLVGKVTGHPVGVAAVADIDVRGVNITYKGEDTYGATLYGWNRVTHNLGASGVPPSNAPASAGGKNDYLYVVGTTGRFSWNGFALRAEFDKNFGENRISPAGNAFTPASRYTGWAFNANASYRAETESGGIYSAWTEFAVGSGRSNTRDSVNDGFEPISGGYRPGTIYGRFNASSVFGGLFSGVPGAAAVAAGQTALPTASASINNRIVSGGGIRLSPGFINKLAISMSYWDFRMHRLPDTPGQPHPFLGNRHLGHEFDLDLLWTHSEYVALAAGVARFQPGGAVYESIRNAVNAGAIGGRGVNAAWLQYFDVRVRF